MQNDAITSDLVLGLRALCYENRSKIEKHPRAKLYCFVCRDDVSMHFRIETMFSPGFQNDEHPVCQLDSVDCVHRQLVVVD
jgi:hypothetical protein